MLAAGMAADNLAMAVYFGVIMSIHVDRTGFTSTFPGGGDDKATEMEVIPTVETLSVSMAAAAAACMIGNGLAAVLPSPFAGSGLAMMAVVASLISTAVAFVSGSKQNGSTIPMFAGSQSLGGVFMLLFFSVVGASTSVQEAVAGGWPLFIFILILFVVWTQFTFG
jgi:Na+/glutamate symporter